MGTQIKFTKLKDREPVFIVRTDSYENLKEFSYLLKGLLPPLKGKRVLIKPNILAPRRPEEGVTTHPSICEKVLIAVLEKGGTPVVGDCPGVSGYGACEKAGEVSGIKSVCKDFFVNLAKEAKRVPLKSRFFSEITLSKICLEVDYIINIPKFKTHTLTYLTGGMKNMFGIVVGGDKALTHKNAPSREEFASAILDIFLIRKPDLTIMDGIVAMEGNGPSGGKLVKAGVLLLSKDTLALDTIMGAIAGVEPMNLPLVRIGAEKGIGNADIDRIPIEGKLNTIKGFKMPSTYYHSTTYPFAYIINRFVFPSFTSEKLALLKKRCNKCSICIKECPSGAMEEGEDGFPRIEKKNCINCYCCMELCPKGAWILGGIINRLRRWF